MIIPQSIAEPRPEAKPGHCEPDPKAYLISVSSYRYAYRSRFSNFSASFQSVTRKTDLNLNAIRISSCYSWLV